MNYDSSQQYGFNFGLAAAATASQQPTAQNVSSTVYPYTFQGAGELQQQQLQAKLASAQAGPTMATIPGKNILYDPHPFQQQQQLQHQQQLQQQLQHQQQLQQHTATFSMVQGGTLVGRQGMFPMAAGLQVAQEPLCSPQAMVDVYGNLSPNMMAQKVPATAAVSATGYKNFGSWMTVPQAINNSIGSNSGSTNTVVSTNSQSALPSFGHLWSHFQQQQQQKQQTAVTTFIQPSPQHQQPQPQQHQPGLANFQSVQVFQSPQAGLQVSPGGLQVSPGGLQVSPSSMQVSPGGQTFPVPQSLQGALSPNPLTTAGVNFSGLRQVQMSGAVGGTVGGGIRNQVVMAPRGQVIMAQTFPTAAAAFNFNSDVKSFQHIARLPSAGHVTGMTASTPAAHHVTTVAAPSPSSAATVHKVGALKEILPAVCSQVALTTTTVTVTTSACSSNTTTATTVHVSVPVTTTISVLPSINTSSCEHIRPTSPLSCLASDGELIDESGRGSVSPSTPSTAASTQESTSGESGKQDLHSVKVPYSWCRVVENGTVHYYSPSNVRLSSSEEIRNYLSQSNTCKCGLECPLIVERTFSFDPMIESKPWSMGDVTCSQDLTKLCNHKRKVLALAAFQSSTTVQDSNNKTDGPVVKCRKREKGKHSDNLLVSPLVVDSKLKTSITNAVNKHAAASAQNQNNSSSSSSTVQPSSAAEVTGVGGSVHSSSAGQTTDSAVHVHAVSQISSAPPNCVVDRSGSIHYPSPSPIAHSPASVRSTPSIPHATGGDAMEGMSPLSNQFPSKMELGRNVGMRIGAGALGVNQVDPRSFPQSSVQCNVYSQEEMKQSYFMQQQLQQHQPPHPHPPTQFNTCGMPVMASAHPGPPFGAQTFRAVSPLGMQSQYPMGFPHSQHQHQQSSQHLYTQHNYPMVCQMNMSPQQQQHVAHPQQQPHPPQSLHHHHQPQPHSMFQNVRMGSQPMWPPQHPPPHHNGPAPPPGYHTDPHQLQGSGVFTGMYHQAGDLMWLETGKPKSKRPRSKKDKQKLNSIVDRTSPCDASVKHKMGPPAPAVSKCLIPSTTTTAMPAVFPTTVSTTTLPCSVSFLENPAIFVAQQTAIINNSLASCQIDLNSPTNPPSNSFYPKSTCDSICSIATSVPVVKIEQDCEEKFSDTNLSLKHSDSVEFKKEPLMETSVLNADSERSVNILDDPETQKPLSSALSVNCNNNQVVVSKNELDIPAVPFGVDCSCGTGNESVSLLQPRKKASPKSKSRAKTVIAATKTSRVNPTCLADCVPAVHQQHGSVQQQAQQQQQHQTVGDASVPGAVPFQIPDLSQLLTAGAGNANWNILSLQQALAQYASVSAGNCSGLNVSPGNGNNANGGGLVEFPASSLLTAAARAQLSQQASLGSFLLPAFLPASSVSGQDVSLAATGVLQPQHPQQPDSSSAAAHSNVSGTELGVKSASTVVAAGLLGVNPVSMASINQTGHLPVQLVQGPSVTPAGVVPTGSFHNGALLTQGLQGVQTVQGLPLNVVLPVNQQLLGLGADPVQGFPMDVSGSVVASVSLGAAVCKSLHVSPKVIATVVDSIAAVSPGANVTVFSTMGSVPAAFSPQGCEHIKGTGSTVHHLPQNNIGHGLSIGQNIGQNVGHNTGQSAAQTLGQTLSQNVGQNVGQNICPSLSAGTNPNVGQNIGVNVSLGLGTGETVMLNSLLPSILAFNTPMPPISLPMVTTVTNSLTQVIPTAGTTPALLAQQQQQQATAQFLNALAIPAVAAAALNPLLIAHPSPVPNMATSPGTQFSSKPVDCTTDDKYCPDNSLETKLEENEQPDECEESTHQKLDDSTESASGDTVRMVDLSQGSQPQILPMVTGDHSQQQVIVLPGGGLPLMQVLSNGSHTLGTTPGVVDKLCNTTQVFLPTAPPAATLPDLAQLGTVAALTPLGIQQMWNSLNSLQLQQLQTLQLQQLVWQQLQGMQALPHHLQTVDACGTGNAQLLPMQFYPGVQQLQQQQQAQASGQQQVQMTVSETDQDEEEMQDENVILDNSGLNANFVDTDKDNGDDTSSPTQVSERGVGSTENLADSWDTDKRKTKEGVSEEISDHSRPVQRSGSASNIQKSLPYAQKPNSSSDLDGSQPELQFSKANLGQTTFVAGSRNKKYPQAHVADLKPGKDHKEMTSSAGSLEVNHADQHVAVNGDCDGTGHQVGRAVSMSRRRGVKRGLDDRYIAPTSAKGSHSLSNAGSANILGMTVMSGPAPKLVGQGPCSM